MHEPTPIVGGNWKMNLDRRGSVALAEKVVRALPPGAGSRVRVVLFPPFPYLLPVAEAIAPAEGRILLGAQDCFFRPSGAYTGEVAPDMLIDCGCTYALAGHSERRHCIGESDGVVGDKCRAILAAGLHCILCVGETIDQREDDQTEAVIARQLEAGLAGVPESDLPRLIIAYEPVWAIGTGKTATPDDAQSAHAHLRRVLASLYDDEIAPRIPIQYGGSVKGSNAASLLSRPGVNGALVGGASLDADEFAAIIAAAADAHPGADDEPAI